MSAEHSFGRFDLAPLRASFTGRVQGALDLEPAHA